jgi:hypothetical protein
MIDAIVVTEFGATPGLLKSEINRLTKEALIAAAENHYREYMPMHFTMAAYSRYGYKPRSAKYLAKKNKIYGHVLPLVYSGTSKNLALSGEPKISATRHRATLIQRARGLNRRRPGSQIHMNREISAVTQSEVNTASRVAGREYLRLARELSVSKTTRV